MTFLELRTELAARGFDYLSTLRLGTYVNRARARLDGMYTWTYREDSAVGVAPLSIPTLGIVEAVSNETLNTPLELMGYADLVAWGYDLSLASTPQYWYRATPAGDPVIATYPTSADTIGVQFWKVCADLSGDADLPEAPARFHGLIVDMAVAMCYRDADNFEAAAALQVEIDLQVAQMMAELSPQQDGMFLHASGRSDW